MTDKQQEDFKKFYLDFNSFVNNNYEYNVGSRENWWEDLETYEIIYDFDTLFKKYLENGIKK